MEIKYNKITSFVEKPKTVKILQFDGENFEEILALCYCRIIVIAYRKDRFIEIRISQNPDEWQELQVGDYIVREFNKEPFVVSDRNNETLGRYLNPNLWTELGDN